jgi:hypothetical protein
MLRLMISRSFVLLLLHFSYSAYSNDCVRKSLNNLLAPELALKLISGASNSGPRAFIAAGKNTRKINEISEISIGQFNLENYVEKGARSVVPLDHKYVMDAIDNKDKLSFIPILVKSPEKQNGIIQTIKAADPDILVVQEIGGMVSLESLNQKLGGQYRSILIPSKSPNPGRPVNQINIGFLVKSDLPFDIEVQSFRNVSKMNSDSPLFSRDLPVITLKQEGTSNPIMAIFGTHFKAMGNESSVLLRREQMKMASKLVEDYSRRNQSLPVFLVGDYNFDVRIASEFSVLQESSGLKDVFNLVQVGKALPKEQRVTQFYFENNAPKFGQLDAISGNKVVEELRLVKSAEIRPGINDSGEIVGLPKTQAEARELSSDHAMLKTVIDFKPLRERLLLAK